MLPLLFAGICTAQNTRAGAPVAPVQRNSLLAARLQSSDSERLRWEGTQLLARLAVPEEHSIERQPIHLQMNNPATLSLPKLRPEWLRPSPQLDLSITDLR